MIRTLALAFLATAALAIGDEERPAGVEQIDATHFKIGEISFDSKLREIQFPAIVNMEEGLLEFLIVHKNGKIHESLLYTEISATHLNIALKLLRYKASPGEETAKESRLKIQLRWEDNGKTRTVPANEWIQHGVNASTMDAGPWTYNGSSINNGKFLPQATGDIAAIFLTGSALITYPGKDNNDDTVWFSYPKRVPPIDTPVTVLISPYPEDQP